MFETCNLTGFIARFPFVKTTDGQSDWRHRPFWVQLTGDAIAIPVQDDLIESFHFSPWPLLDPYCHCLSAELSDITVDYRRAYSWCGGTSQRFLFFFPHQQRARFKGTRKVMWKYILVVQRSLGHAIKYYLGNLDPSPALGIPT